MPAPISTKRANALLSFRLASVAGSTMPLNEMSRVKDIDRFGELRVERSQRKSQRFGFPDDGAVVT